MNLFKDFKQVSYQEWLDKINIDLKGKNFTDTLIWKTDEEINVQPFYNSESLKDNISQHFDVTHNNINNEIREQIEITSIKEANHQALNALKGGANSIQFNGMIATPQEMNELLNDIMLDVIAIHFYTPNPEQTLRLFNSYLKANNIDKSKLNGSISFDFLGEVLISGNWIKNESADFKQLYNIQNNASLKTISIRGDYYSNAGASITQELAYTLSHAVEYIDQLTELGLSSEKVINNITFSLGINSNYFFEIAKIRAFRILWQIVTEAYGVKITNTYIHSQTTSYNIAAQDAQTNILRTTTEGMSAILGGCNSLSITPFNFAYENPSDFTLRVARNIQIIIKEEAYLNKVQDISKGSYYIENLTDQLVTKVLNLFKDIENNGGFLANIQNDHIQNNIHLVNSKKEQEYKDGSRSLLGVNIHLNKIETTPSAKINTTNNSDGTITQLEQVNIPQILAQKETTNV
tara:strand:- start:7002 stop:8393 length:1392 start_codon:yes stop_codon:yes gene_type:complete